MSSVNGDGPTGGLIGRGGNEEIVIVHCYNTGSVYCSGSYTGGIAGKIWGVITDCYNTGSVESGNSNSFGGIGNADTIQYCFNAGKICGGTGSSTINGTVVSNAGAIGSGTISNCFYLSGTANYESGFSTTVGYVLTEDEMKSSGFLDKLKAGRSDTLWIQKDGEMPTLDI